jgi:hypothetical protein
VYTLYILKVDVAVEEVKRSVIDCVARCCQNRGGFCFCSCVDSSVNLACADACTCDGGPLSEFKIDLLLCDGQVRTKLA